MATLEKSVDAYHIEPLGEGVRFVLPRRTGGGQGGLCAILFGMMFCGFALLWSMAHLGVMDPLLESMSDSLFGDFPHHDTIHGDEAPGPIETPATPEAAPEQGPESPAVPETLETPESPKPPATATEKPTAYPDFPADHPLYQQGRPTPAVDPNSGGFDIGRILMALFGLPFFLVGLMPIAAGIMGIVGHAEIEITREQITLINRAGPLRRRQHRGSAGLKKLEIGRSRANMEQAVNSGRPSPLTGGNAVHAQFESEPDLPLALGYCLSTLRPLAADLAMEHQRITKGRRVEVEEPHVDFGISLEPFVAETVPPQPAGSTVQLEELRNGVTLRIPPAGLTKPALAMFLFAAIWLGITGIFTFVMLAIGVPWVFLIFISIFWLVGIMVGVAGVNFMRGQAVIDVVHDTLLISRQGPFGRSQHEWRSEDLLDIRVDDSGTTINNRTLQNLQFVPREGSTLAMFTGRDEAELHWMAAVVRNALMLRQAKGENPK